MNDAVKAAWHGRNAVSHKVLSVEQTRDFDRLGYHFPLRAFSPAQIAAYRSKLESFEQAHGGTLSGQLRNKPHLLFTWADEIIRHPAILDAVEDVLGPDLLAWSSSFFTKDPKDPASRWTFHRTVDLSIGLARVWQPFDETQDMLGVIKIQILNRFLAKAQYCRG